MRTPSPLPPAPRIKRKRQKTAQNGTSCILFLEMGCIFLFYNVTIAIAMTNIHPFTTAAACILTAGAALFTSSCQPASPESYARQFATAQHVSVHGYNGRETLTSRVYADWGSMPANARRAMEEYIKGAEWKTMDYIRPQYFIQVDRSFWAICIDNDGNMTGIIPFRNGKDARKMSVVVPPKGAAPSAAPAAKSAATSVSEPGATEETPADDTAGTEEEPSADSAAESEDTTTTDDAAVTDDF